MAHFFYHAVARLPKEFSEVLFNINENVCKNILEINLRANRELVLTAFDKDYLVNYKTKSLSLEKTDCIKITSTQLQQIFLHLCNNSVYSYEESIKKGYITILGGHRVGIAGKAILENEKIVGIKDITSLNIRIARCMNINLDARIKAILCDKTPKVLIVGKPCTGKTTLLRAVSSFISLQGKKVCVIDEREEIWPQQSGNFIAQPPLRCDVVCGFLKGDGALLALRSLSPNVIICDEIGSEKDTLCLQQALNSGVGMVATAHANSIKEILSRPQVAKLFKNQVFDYIVMLDDTKNIGDVKEVVKVADYT